MDASVWEVRIWAKMHLFTWRCVRSKLNLNVKCTLTGYIVWFGFIKWSTMAFLAVVPMSVCIFFFFVSVCCVYFNIYFAPLIPSNFIYVHFILHIKCSCLVFWRLGLFIKRINVSIRQLLNMHNNKKRSIFVFVCIPSWIVSHY